MPECHEAFDGDNAWDQWMEHVARHMDGLRKKVVFDGEGAGTLVERASRWDVAVIERGEDGWVLKRDPGARLLRPLCTRNVLFEVDGFPQSHVTAPGERRRSNRPRRRAQVVYAPTFSSLFACLTLSIATHPLTALISIIATSRLKDGCARWGDDAGSGVAVRGVGWLHGCSCNLLRAGRGGVGD